MSLSSGSPEDPFDDPTALIPAVVQHARTGKVLMLGYMNREALDKTLATGRVTFFSRSKGRLWMKGESSGHVLQLSEIRWDCDRDTLLVLAHPEGPTCHTGTESCFDGRVLYKTPGPAPAFETLANLTETIKSRAGERPENSYVATLLTGPLGPLLKKMVEEAGETMAAVYEGNPASIRSEMADLLFHLLVTMERTGASLSDIIEILEKRTGKSGLEEKRNRRASNIQPEEAP